MRPLLHLFPHLSPLISFHLPTVISLIKGVKMPKDTFTVRTSLNLPETIASSTSDSDLLKSVEDQS